MNEQTRYAQELALFGTRAREGRSPSRSSRFGVLPFVASPFLLDLANQVLLASIGALALMLLTGFAGLISLGTAGLLGGRRLYGGRAVPRVRRAVLGDVPAAALLGALLGLIFGLPSMRLRGLYLAISTLGLHFVMVYLGGEYEAREVAVDRRDDRSAVDRQLQPDQRPGVVCGAARICGAGASDQRQPQAHAHRPRLAGAARARCRRRRARHRCAALQAPGLRRSAPP